jgi:hypothetical protein
MRSPDELSIVDEDGKARWRWVRRGLSLILSGLATQMFCVVFAILGTVVCLPLVFVLPVIIGIASLCMSAGFVICALAPRSSRGQELAIVAAVLEIISLFAFLASLLFTPFVFFGLLCKFTSWLLLAFFLRQVSAALERPELRQATTRFIVTQFLLLFSGFPVAGLVLFVGMAAFARVADVAPETWMVVVLCIVGAWAVLAVVDLFLCLAMLYTGANAVTMRNLRTVNPFEPHEPAHDEPVPVELLPEPEEHIEVVILPEAEEHGIQTDKPRPQ